VYSKIKIAGHPVHPMLVTFPVACYTTWACTCSLSRNWPSPPSSTAI
jgi:uncharacterized membrane protein